MRSQRQTKIVATVGPASDSEEALSSLVEAGVNVFRFNFSHGTHEEHAARLEIVRSLEEKFGHPIGVLADLQGPKLRVGHFADGEVQLEDGQIFRFDLSDEAGTNERVQLPHPEVFSALHEGASLLLDDGKLRLEVVSCDHDHAEAKVIVGGPLSDHKGLNLPNVALGISSLTDKDRRDLEFALEIGIELIALSFVQGPKDVEEAKQLIDGRGFLISKLEKPSAVEHLEEIIAASDGVMVARGDLGVELPPEKVPSIQKHIVRASRQAGKPVIVATQMLDSMVKAPTPTRAEASDVANSVFEGADAVMLSAETAVGDHPAAVVAVMGRIISETENDLAYPEMLNAGFVRPQQTAEDVISESAKRTADILPTSAIVTMTGTGRTALRASRERPSAPILCLTSSSLVARAMCLVWGVQASLVEEVDHFEQIEAIAIRKATERGLTRPGSYLALTAGIPLHSAGASNALRLLQIEPADDTA